MKLWVSTPSHRGNVRVEFMTSMMKLQSYCIRNAIPFTHHLISGESLITRNRNELVNAFLKSDYTHFLSVDDDIEFQPEDVMKLIRADKDIIGAKYPVKTKTENPDYVIYPLPETSDNLISEVACIGTGLLLIKREVFDKLKEHYPNDWYLSDTGPNRGERLHMYFDTGIRNNIYLSEDYWLCDNYRRIGGKVYYHPGIKLTHYGFYGYK